MAHMIEPCVGQLQAQAIFPVQPAAYRIGSLAVGQILHELEDGDQGQTPQGIGWLPTLWVQISKQLILVDGSQRVTQMDIQVALLERLYARLEWFLLGFQGSVGVSLTWLCLLLGSW